MGGAAYLITRDPQIRNSPDAARTRLRADGFDTFEEAVKAAESQGLVTVSFQTVTLGTDVVCAMIGNTPELVPDTQDAWKAGYSELVAADGSTLSLYYNRYKVATLSFQKDTILMIGSISGYWSGVNAITNGWWQPNPPYNPFTVERLFDENPDAHDNYKNIPEVIRWIKHQHG
jgi:hypothetical protein